MSDLKWSTVPPLRRPFLLMSFEGLFDAGGAATGALARVRERSDTSKTMVVLGLNGFGFAIRNAAVLGTG